MINTLWNYYLEKKLGNDVRLVNREDAELLVAAFLIPVFVVVCWLAISSLFIIGG